MRIFLAGLLVISLSIAMATACQSSRQPVQRDGMPLQKVEEGMSPTEVRTVIGTPVQTIREEGEIQWMVYESGTNRFRIYFREGEVAGVPGRRNATANLDGR